MATLHAICRQAGAGKTSRQCWALFFSCRWGSYDTPGWDGTTDDDVFRIDVRPRQGPIGHALTTRRANGTRTALTRRSL
jgi:hypothetical protein